MPSAGSRPRTVRQPPTGRSRSARSISRCAPRSSPRSSRSIVMRGNTAPRVVKTGCIDGPLERAVARDPAVAPRFETFEVEQGPNGGVGVRHPQQQVSELVRERAWRTRRDCHVAMVKLRGLGEDACRPTEKRAITAEREVVRIDHARRVDLPVYKRARRVALPADVIAV